ncbi:hypothetical protein GGR53DRAFT_78248 [Hypoxylon sp. FL1150]|nr:hypothetical protein GGR53DRAFT_78248 [Hypoxylon sp. FL1150]
MADTPPDFDKLDAAFINISREFRLACNLLQESCRGQQELRQEVQDLRRGQEGIQAQLDILTQRTNLLENASIRFKNKQNLQPNPNAAVLLPLKDVTTGEIIPNCPTSKQQIHRLSQARADRILTALQITIPVALDQKRVAVLRAFV